ncbi:MAG: flagellar hook assembly protein FlgD [Gemmobacter sp.]|nr:flagellar hook assembly protein FlgD [Gemmobacter sp.]
MIVSAASSATTTASQTQSSTPVSSSLTSDFQTFLRLMTTQLQYQDPMNPVDSTQYLSQLASFSAVEQQTQTNKLLTSIQGSFNMLGMAQVASWVGSEARAEMPAIVTSGEDVTIAPQILQGAEKAVLVVRDSEGELVARVDLPLDATSYEWEPLDAAGEPLPDGTYDLSVENSAEGEETVVTGVELYARVVEVQGLGDQIVLLMEGDRRILADNVTAIRG